MIASYNYMCLLNTYKITHLHIYVCIGTCFIVKMYYFDLSIVGYI